MKPPWSSPLLNLAALVIYSFSIIQALEVEDVLYEAAFQELLQSGELNLKSEDDTNLHVLQENTQDMKDANPSGPWSHKPICTTYDLPRLNNRLCVYTDTSFNNGRGISIFTTPQIATKFASLLDSVSRNIIAGEHDAVGTNTFSRTWYTAQIPGKGTGMLAKQSLERGDTITSHTPVLLAYKENMLSKPEREKLLQLAVNQLPPRSREAYLALTTMYHDPSILAQDIASANSFEMAIAGKAHLAVIPEPSCMNHDCAPNAIFHVNSSSLTHTVRATRTIKKDQEITISYTNPLDAYVKRQNYLSTSFGFECTCSRCSLGDAGDATLSEIASLQQSLSRWADSTSSATVKQAERLIQLHRQEGLDGYLDPAYCIAALMYNSVGSERGAMKYVKLCIEAIELRLGSAAEDLPQWRAMLADPKAHWSWRRRKRG